MMIRNYFAIAFRNLFKYKGHTGITIGGLAIGIACCILILLYVGYELGYDRYHANADRIRRVEVANWATTSLGVAPYMKEEFSDVEEAVRLYRVNRAVVGTEPRMFAERSFFFADSGLFRVFSFPLLAGDPEKALAAPYSIVLTRDMASKYFGDENPIGKRLNVQTGRSDIFMVTGVVENVPLQSHFHFDFLASMSSLPFRPDDNRTQWGASLAYSYALLKPGTDVHRLEQQVSHTMHVRANIPDTSALDAYLRPITDIHLYSECEKEVEPVGSISYVYILSTIAVFILLLAAVNFINLSTAQSMRRAREVAMRKTLGAYRGQLIGQFLGESLVSIFLATIMAVGVVELVLPTFNAVTGVHVSLLGAAHVITLFAIVAPSILVALIAGSYPAFYLSQFQPARILKSGATATTLSSGAALLRKALVVLQFTVSIALIVGSMIISRQLAFLQSKKLGLDPEQVMVMPISNISQERYTTLKSELISLSSVAGVTGSHSVPGERVIIEGFEPRHASEKDYSLRLLLVDFDFVETYGFTVSQGRAFSRNFVADTGGAFMINEKAAELFQWSHPVGEWVGFPAQQKAGTIVGVVKDFNFASLHSDVEPLIILLSTNTRFYQYISVRLSKGDKRQAVNDIETVWRRVTSDRPFEFYFLDESFRRLYTSEMKLQSIVTSFTLIGMFIACLGLLGLVSHAVVRRTKEIGVRKVLGASVPGIVGLVTREFLKLVLLANVIAFPVAFFLMKKWLENFAYRIDMDVLVFLLAGLAALVVAFLTIGVQAIRAAQANPVESLRYE